MTLYDTWRLRPAVALLRRRRSFPVLLRPPRLSHLHARLAQTKPFSRSLRLPNAPFFFFLLPRLTELRARPAFTTSAALPYANMRGVAATLWLVRCDVPHNRAGCNSVLLRENYVQISTYCLVQFWITFSLFLPRQRTQLLSLLFVSYFALTIDAQTTLLLY